MGEDKTKNFEYSLKLLVKTSFIVLIGIFISKILGYTYRIIIARSYGPEVYGLYSLAIMILGWIISLSSLGLAEGLLRFIPQYRGKKESKKVAFIFKFTTRLLLVTSLVSGLLLFTLSEFISVYIFHNSDLIILLKIISFFVPIAVISNLTLISLRAYELISSFSFVSNVLQNIIRVISLVIFGLFAANASLIVLSYCLGFLAVLIASYLICKIKIPDLFINSKIPSKQQKTIKKDFLAYSIPLLFFGVASMVFYWIDSFFLGYYRGAESVGLYNAAVPIATLLLIVPELFMQLFFPMINREYYNKNYGLIKDLSKQLGKWIFMGNLPIFILIFIFPGAAINLLFGSQYVVAENALRILIFGSFLTSISTISNNLLSMKGRSKLILFDMLLACFINILLNAWLIPLDNLFGLSNNYGINGAAIATSLSLLFLNILFFVQAKKEIGILPLRVKMLHIFVMASISAGVLFYLRTFIRSQNIFVIGLMAFGFILLYALLILISRSLDKNDWNIVLAIKKKFIQK